MRTVFISFFCLALVWSGCGGSRSRLRVGEVPGGEIVEAEGAAPYEAGNLIETKRKALLEAQRAAVEKVVGVYLSSRLRVEKATMVEQQILANTQGYVEKYELLSEGREGDAWQVRIRALVRFEQIGEDLRNAGLELGPALKKPRVAVLLEESVEGRMQESLDGTAAVSQKLIERGFSLVERSAAAAASTQKILDAVEEGDVSGAAAFSREVGADILVVGPVQAEALQETRLGGFHSYRARAVLQSVQAGTGRIIASVSKEASGLDPSPSIAAAKALEAAGRLAAEELAPLLEKSLTAGSPVEVRAKGVQDVNRLLDLKQVFLGLPQVREVELLSFAAGQAILEIWMNKGGGEELAAELLRVRNPQIDIQRVAPYELEILSRP
ncbi:MAG: hypothetical protein HY402_00295 [Elusimicrobia bacterium]|nr:hypothetical protein [Elusimicrobiota bacterium]